MTTSDGHDLPNRRPARVASRPFPSQWERTELLTLEEAASLFWPQGPITVRTLRTAMRDEVLAVTWIAGKVFTTPESIADMTRCRPNPKGRSPAIAEPDRGAQALPPPVSASAQALLKLLAEEKAKLPSRYRQQQQRR